MNRTLLLAMLPRAVLLLFVVLLALSGGWHLLWLVPAAFLVWDIVRTLRPTAAGVPPQRFNEPGEYRVVLQVPGPRPVTVIREIRRIRTLGLLEAKQLVDAAPVVVAEGLSEQSAELVADRLRAAGARALAAPIGEM